MECYVCKTSLPAYDSPVNCPNVNNPGTTTKQECPSGMCLTFRGSQQRNTNVIEDGKSPKICPQISEFSSHSQIKLKSAFMLKQFWYTVVMYNFKSKSLCVDLIEYGFFVKHFFLWRFCFSLHSKSLSSQPCHHWIFEMNILRVLKLYFRSRAAVFLGWKRAENLRHRHPVHRLTHRGILPPGGVLQQQQHPWQHSN